MISIIVPIYNVEQYLEECLFSICNQIESTDEVILINDGSTDNSEAICRKYNRKYSNVILINQMNMGLSAARNIGIRNASKDYIMFVDSDDYIKENSLERIKTILLNNRIDVLMYGAEIKDELRLNIKNPYERKSKYCNKMMSGVALFQGTFYDNYIVSACLSVYKRQYIEEGKFTFPLGIYFEDNLFHLEVLSKAHEVLIVEDKFYIRRYREESITTSQNSIRKCEDTIKLQQLMWAYLKENQGIFLDREFLKDFLSYWALYTLKRFEDGIDIRSRQRLQKSYAELFIEHWWDVFFPFSKNINHILPIYKVIAIQRNQPYMEMFCIQARQRMVDYIVRKLNEIPFNIPGLLVGIYGLGKHTESVLSLYEKYIGTIQCDYFFIQTEKSKDSYGDKEIVSVDHINKNVDCILISSKIYQDDMIKNLLHIGIPSKLIISLYNFKDLVDLVEINELLCDRIIE